MKCKDCELEKCVHTFNANNVDKCKRIREVRMSIDKYNGLDDAIRHFADVMAFTYDKSVCVLKGKDIKIILK